MTHSLPANASLENLKNQAKTLRKEWSARSAEAFKRIRRSHPKYSGLSDEQLFALNPKLTDCQLVLAREAGFRSWPQLKVAIEAANRDLPDEFLDLACLCYDDPHYDHRSFHARAQEMLRENLWLTGADIWCAAASGDARAVTSFLDEEPELINRPGLHGWMPLICACYSRVKPVSAGHSALDVATLLLDHGANPNAYTMKGNADERLNQTPRRFSALTGLVGGGSTGLANQPPHPQWRELAELLLSRGAGPADEMALSINQDACLELLLRHGLKADAITSEGVTLMGRALAQAARRGNIEQVRLLLVHHARTDERYQGKLPWEHAMRSGQVEVAHLLEDAGAPVSELDVVERFVSFCMAGNSQGARAMVEQDPDLLVRAPKDMVHRAVGTNRKEAVQLVLELGFDPNYQEDNPAITNTGVLSGNYEIVRILLAHGASLKLRDPWYDSTGAGWADFFNCADLRDKLLSEPGICLFDALDYNRLDRVPEILASDPAALERPFATCLSRPPKPEDWHAPLGRMVVRGRTEAVRVLLENGADPGASLPDGRSLLQVARDQGLDEIAELLKARIGC